ncbi:MAG: ATP synthase F0 subunit C [Planctomycetota bacterium]
MVFEGAGLAIFGISVGIGLTVIGAGVGISKIAHGSVESMARQPEVAGKINGAMILTAAFIEGVALFGCVIAYMMQSGLFEVFSSTVPH